MTRDPKNPFAWTPALQTPDQRGFGGAQQKSLGTDAAHSLLWVGRILHVDTETMVCSIQIETGGIGERADIPLPAPGGGGPRSWSGNIPERGTKVILGWRKYDNRSYVPYIIEFMTVGTYAAREFDPFSTVDPTDAVEALAIDPDMEDDVHFNLGVTRLKLRKAYGGDHMSSASSGGDFLLDRNAHLMNRAGNEFQLRDSDQTAVLQTLNEFVSNAAGYYRRGLIRRSSFNLLPDLAISGFNPATDDFDKLIEGMFTTGQDSSGKDVRSILTKVRPGTAAFDKLRQFGLINEDGTLVEPVDSDPNDLFYPFVVTADGQRQSYTVFGEHENSFADTDTGYVEDRVELRHVSNGVMAVTEDGDGVQVDPIPPILIESVMGTVVGNDPYTEPGRSIYKRIITMRVFDDPDQGSPSAGPIFEPVDTITSQTEADTKALCRLFRVQSPSGGNQYAFGITKEGRVLLHVPKSQAGTSQDRGKSIDANIAGLVKAIIGVDENTRTSLDLRMLGGVKLDIGSFVDSSDPNSPQAVSVDLTLRGKIRTTYAGEQGRESIIGGSDFRSASGSTMDFIGGNAVRGVGGSISDEAFSITHNAGFGGYKMKCAGDRNQTVLGKTSELFAQIRLSTFALADTKTMIAGIDSTTVLAGGIARTVVTGNITDTAATGNYLMAVGTGNMALNVGAGNLAATVGAGNLALSAGAGNATMTAGAIATVVAGTIANIASPVTKIGLSVVGFVVAGAPGPGGPHIDYVTGIPILGVPTVSIGP